MFKHRFLPGIVLVFLLSMPVKSQEFWSLDRCINYAVENNIQLRQQSLLSEAARNNLNQSKIGLLPSLNTGINQSFRFGRSVDPLTYEFTTENSKGASFYVASDLDLFRGLQNFNTIQKNRIDLEKNLKDLEKAQNDLALNITRLFLQILFNEELYEITSQQL